MQMIYSQQTLHYYNVFKKSSINIVATAKTKVDQVSSQYLIFVKIT